MQMLECLMLSPRSLILFSFKKIVFLSAVLIGVFHYSISTSLLCSVLFNLLFIPSSVFFISTIESFTSDWIFFCIF